VSTEQIFFHTFLNLFYMNYFLSWSRILWANSVNSYLYSYECEFGYEYLTFLVQVVSLFYYLERCFHLFHKNVGQRRTSLLGKLHEDPPSTDLMLNKTFVQVLRSQIIDSIFLNCCLFTLEEELQFEGHPGSWNNSESFRLRINFLVNGICRMEAAEQ